MMSSKLCIVLFWFCVIYLLVVGLVMVSSTAAWAGETLDPYEPLVKQSTFAGIGLLGAILLAHIDYRIWRKYVWWILLFACVLLALCYVPGIGRGIHGARRWITIGQQFQPSECAKICMVMALGHYMALYRNQVHTLLHGAIYPGLIACAPIFLIFFEKDMGTAAALSVAAGCVLLVAGTRIIYLTAAVILGAGTLVYFVVNSPNRMGRIEAWLDLEASKQGAGLQQYHSKIALSRGGLTGVGLGNSTEKHGTLPFAHTDFIYAPLGEEFGFFGTLSVLLAYFVMAYAGMGMAMQCRDPYGRYLAVGGVTIIFCPAMLNIAVVIAALPNTGLPLPFISYGGTNLVFTLAAVGMITSVQRYGTDSQPECEITRKNEDSIDVRL